MIRTILIAAAALSLAACASTQAPEPIVRTVEVKIPVAVSCVPKDLRDPPGYVDGDAALKAAAGPEDRYQLLGAGRIQRKQRLAELEPIIKGCRTP
jgi:hypothetical protein